MRTSRPSWRRASSRRPSRPLSRWPILSSATPLWPKLPRPSFRLVRRPLLSQRSHRSRVTIALAHACAGGSWRGRALGCWRRRPMANRITPTAPSFKATLMDLIQNTVATKSWIDNGGNGTISEFPTGVWVDPNGVLRPLLREARSGDLAALRTRIQPSGEENDVHGSSPLRMISLNRLEKQIQLRAALGENPDEAMKYLAGLRRIEYVFAYPETGDLVIAGPAGDWTVGPENRIVSAETGGPVVQLDDLVVVFRHMMKGSDAYFGCKIDPRRGRPEGCRPPRVEPGPPGPHPRRRPGGCRRGCASRSSSPGFRASGQPAGSARPRRRYGPPFRRPRRPPRQPSRRSDRPCPPAGGLRRSRPRASPGAAAASSSGDDSGGRAGNLRHQRVREGDVVVHPPHTFAGEGSGVGADGAHRVSGVGDGPDDGIVGRLGRVPEAAASEVRGATGRRPQRPPSRPRASTG